MNIYKLPYHDPVSVECPRSLVARVAKSVDARDLKSKLSTRIGNGRVNGVKFGGTAARQGGCNTELSPGLRGVRGRIRIVHRRPGKV